VEKLVNGRSLRPCLAPKPRSYTPRKYTTPAAALHDRATELFDTLGKAELASGERERAEADRNGAAADRERARLRHDWIASHGS
jgi:hypothetical protein